MAQLKNKSDINQLSAKLLQKECLYPAVIHCAYYSCFQLMKHILIHVLKKDENQFESERRAKGNQGTHEHLINFFLDELKNNDPDREVFNEHIIGLRKLRRKSDYCDSTSIDYVSGNKSLILSESIIKLLHKNFKI